MAGRSEGVWFGAAACANVCPQKRMRAVYSAEVTFLALTQKLAVPGRDV